MRRVATPLVIVLLLGIAAASLWAQAGAGTGGQSAAVQPPTKDAQRDALITTLLAMSPAQRRDYLSNLPREERLGLWMALKRVQLGNASAAHYADLQGQEVTAQPPPSWTHKLRTKNTVGTITYDSGFPTIGFGGGALVGNRFNTHTGIPVCNPGTVSTIQALVVPGPANATSSAGFVLLGPQTSMGGAMALFSSFQVATGVIDSLSFAGLGVSYTGSEFFVLFGDFATVYIPVFGTGTTLGQGHHGLVGYTGGMGPNITGTFDFGGALNSYIRASGVIVPVELMSFDVG